MAGIAVAGAVTASLAGPVGSAAHRNAIVPAPVVEPTPAPASSVPTAPTPSPTPVRASPVPASRSSARPTLRPKRTYPVLAAAKLDWTALAKCESGGDPKSTNDGAGNYFGLYQFSVSTWRSVGGTGLPNQASAAEQTYRAELLYDQQGSSPWPSCGHHLLDK